MKNIVQSYAGFWVRVSAFALDYIAIAVYLIVLFLTSRLIDSIFPGALQQVFDNPVSGQTAGFFSLTLPMILYFALLESSTGQATWGKRKMHLKVIRIDGGRLGLGRAICRTVLKFIPWELAHTCIWQIRFAPQGPSPILMAGFILVWLLVIANAVSIFISPSHQALYDRLAGTNVVNA